MPDRTCPNLPTNRTVPALADKPSPPRPDPRRLTEPVPALPTTQAVHRHALCWPAPTTGRLASCPRDLPHQTRPALRRPTCRSAPGLADKRILRRLTCTGRASRLACTGLAEPSRADEPHQAEAAPTYPAPAVPTFRAVPDLTPPTSRLFPGPADVPRTPVPFLLFLASPTSPSEPDRAWPTHRTCPADVPALSCARPPTFHPVPRPADTPNRTLPADTPLPALPTGLTRFRSPSARHALPDPADLPIPSQSAPADIPCPVDPSLPTYLAHPTPAFADKPCRHRPARVTSPVVPGLTRPPADDPHRFAPCRRAVPGPPISERPDSPVHATPTDRTDAALTSQRRTSPAPQTCHAVPARLPRPSHPPACRPTSSCPAAPCRHTIPLPPMPTYLARPARPRRSDPFLADSPRRTLPTCRATPCRHTWPSQPTCRADPRRRTVPSHADEPCQPNPVRAGTRRSSR
jgi:hypothetical protein